MEISKFSFLKTKSFSFISQDRMIPKPDLVDEIPEGEKNRKCKTCRVQQMLSWLGDNECDEPLNNEECCYDAGDCFERYAIL